MFKLKRCKHCHHPLLFNSAVAVVLLQHRLFQEHQGGRMKKGSCVDGICDGCHMKPVCKQKEPTFNTLLRKEGLLEEKLAYERRSR